MSSSSWSQQCTEEEDGGQNGPPRTKNELAFDNSHIYDPDAEQSLSLAQSESERLVESECDKESSIVDENMNYSAIGTKDAENIPGNSAGNIADRNSNSLAVVDELSGIGSIMYVLLIFSVMFFYVISLLILLFILLFSLLFIVI